jgi:hypothetical protein
VSITNAEQLVSADELLRRADVAMYRVKHQRSATRHVLRYDLAELDGLRSRLRELERKGSVPQTANR